MIVIIGTGLAGYMLAKELRKIDQDAELTLVTRGQGAFYSKPLLSTALTSKKTPEQLVITPAAKMAEQLNAKVLTETEVTAIDVAAKKIKLHDVELPYDKLVLACGAETLQVPLAGNAVVDMFSINTIEDYAKFRAGLQPEKKRIAILGSGLVGCEFANDLLNTDHELEIVSIDSYPLAKFVPEKIGRALEQAFAAKGVIWHLGVGAVAVDKNNSEFTVKLANGKSITAELVISAVGLRAEMHLARAAGLQVNRGIVVNRLLQTSDPNIYALGDCAEVEGEVKQYVAPILQCARTLAKILAGGQDPVVYPSMPIVIKTPLCPVVTIPPPGDVEGDWQCDGDDSNLRALFYDQEQNLRGFSLCGDRVREKLELAKQLPLVFA